ncbi:MAG: DUF2341 domain-containing protein, partial [Kiritimatiellae bacterium]|nr:DUF2341 domain-containing protein [Kiritimatiellia bacterium]
MSRRLATALVAALALSPLFAAEYVYRLPMTVTGYSGQTLEDFPVLVRLSEGTNGFSYADCALDGSDIRFADGDGRPVPHEIDDWNPQGESCLWVKLPTLSAGTAFEMRYGGNPTSVNTPSDVWGGFAGVWHMNENASSQTDRTGNGLTATMDSGVTYELVDGPVGNSVKKNGGLRTADFFASGHDYTVPTAAYTVSGWYYLPDWTASANISPLVKGTWEQDGWYVQHKVAGGYEPYRESMIIVYKNSLSNKFSVPDCTKNWTYLTVVWDGTALTVYANGAQRIRSTTAFVHGTYPFIICNGASCADETRVMRAGASADYVAADYASQAGTLVSYGMIESEVRPVFAPGEWTVGATTATLPATLVSAGAGASGATVSVAYGPYAGNLPPATTVAAGVTAGGTFTVNLTGLTGGTTYHYAITAVNDAASAQSYTLSGSFTVPAYGSPVATARHTNRAAASAVVVEIDECGFGSAYCDVYFASGPDAASLSPETLAAGAVREGAAVTNQVANSVNGEALAYRVRVVNEQGVEWTSSGSFVPQSNAEYVYRLPITVMGYSGQALPNFPVLVRLAEGRDGFSYGACEADGSDIRFVDRNGTTLSFDIDTWNPQGESLIWVKIPSLAKRTFFEMRYGGNPTTEITPSDTWSSYGGVWHMNEPSGTVANAAPTGSAYDAVPKGDTANSVLYAGADAPVGGARKLMTGNERGYLHVEGDISALGLGSTFTMSGWIRMDSVSGYPRFFSTKPVYDGRNGWEIEVNSGSDRAFTARAGNNSPLVSGSFAKTLVNNWVYVVFCYDGSTLTVYGDGARVAGGSVLETIEADQGLAFGCNPTGDNTHSMRAAYDECRLMNGAASADYVAADYASQTGTLLVYGIDADYVEVTSAGSDFGPVSPGYGTLNVTPGNTYTFTAPAYATNSIGSLSAPCTGWNLYRVDAATPFRTSADAGETATSCTIAYSEPVTLEWTWGAETVHGWRYDSTAKTLTELEPPEGGLAWILNCTASGTNLTVTGVAQTGSNSVLDLRPAATAADGTEYAVVIIGASAFKANEDITDVRLPDTLVEVGNFAFQNCPYLSRVQLSNTLKKIGDTSFGGCLRLKTVEPFLPDTLTSIANNAFNGDRWIASPLRLGFGTAAGGAALALSLGESVFRGCAAIPSAEVGPGVTVLPVSTFYTCTSLASVALHDGITRINNDCFNGCTALARVTPSPTPAALTSLGQSAFRNCSLLAGEVSLGASVADCTLAGGGSQFYNCANITKIVLGPGVSGSIPTTFAYCCTSLGELTISARVTGIGSQAFEGCTALPAVVLPQGLTSLGGSAFSGCTSLASVTPLLPDGVASVGSSAFRGCTSLGGDLSIAPGGAAATIGEYAFYQTRITSAALGDGITTINQYAFYQCPALESVTLPANLATLGANAFNDCKALTTVTPFLPASVKSVGGSAFRGCTSLGGDLSIAPGGAAATIGEYAFYQTRITSLEMGDGITTINQFTFYQCPALESVTLPANLATLGANAFNDCKALTTVTPFLPASVKTVGGSAFSGCNVLEGDLVVGTGDVAVTFGESVFQYCYKLKSATLGANVASIPAWVFRSDTALERVVFGSTKPTVNGNAFYGVSSYQMLLVVPAASEAWNDFVGTAASATAWGDLTDAQRKTYTDAHPTEPLARALTVAAPANQWV